MCFPLFKATITHALPYSHSVRILLATWILVSLILAHSYSGVFYSKLALLEFENPIDTIEDMMDLLDNDHFQLHTSRLRSTDFLSATKDENELFYKIGQHIRRYVL